MTSRRAPPSTMRTRNTIRVSPASESSQPGASGQDHTPSSMYDSTTVISEKNTLFLPQELKLGGPSNWEQYCPAQKAILRINGLEDAVFGDYPPEEQQTIDQKIRAAKAAVSIRGNCTGEALSQLVGIENPQEMFNLLQAYCIGTGPVLLQTTLYQFIRIKTSSYETIPQFNVDFERLVKLLLEQKEPISDTLKKVVYLTACENEYPDWTARQRALLRSEHPPTLRSIQQDLIDENRSSDDDDSHGTASTYWAHSKKTGRKGPTARKQETSGRRRGSSKNRRGPNKSSQETNHRVGKHKDHTCTNCKKRGHHENDCWFAHKGKRPDWAVRLAKELMEHDLQRDNTKNLHIKESNHMTVERSFLILEDSVSDELPMDNTEKCRVSLGNISSPTAWLFDTGSSVHICNDQSLFTELQPATRTVLITGGGKVYPSGRGTVKICFINKWGDQVTINLKDTLFIPEFPVNVMSGLRLYKNGGWIDGNDIYDPTGDVFGLLRIGRDGLYVNTEVGKTAVSNQAVSELQPEPCNHHTVSSNQCLNVDLWHRRLGHVNAYQVSQTAKMTRGMYCDDHHDHQPFNYCLACDIAKALRWTPRNKRKRASRAGFIHVDTFKVNPPGIRGERWGMIATDDRHRMRWAYTFTRKGMASELLGQLISKIRTQYGIRVYAIQMDGGSELYGASLKNLEYTHGVKIIKTTPYTPEFNGVAERSNRIIFDKVRATMESERIPIELWPLVLEDMVRKTNVTATRAIDGLTPMESFLNEAFPGQDNKPDLSGERICGSQVTIHIPQERRLRSHKFGPRGETGIYLCMEGSQIYTCWVPSRRKGHQIVRSANVKFYEKVGEKELLTETEHDVEPEIRKNGAPISSRPQSVTEQTKTPSPQRSEVNNLQHAEVHNPQHGQTTTSMTSAKLPDLRKEVITEPKTMTEALQGPQREHWLRAIHSELRSLLTKGTWRMLDRNQAHNRPLTVKWVFKVKKNEDGNLDRFKARLVVRGFEQQFGFDYNQTFASVAKAATWRILLTVAACLDWEIEQMDVSTAFLEGDLEEEVFIEMPEGLVEYFDQHPEDRPPGFSTEKICKLIKSLYGLKQAPRQWQKKLKEALESLDFRQATSDTAVYHNPTTGVIIITYVDDFLIMGSNKEAIQGYKARLGEIFTMTDLGPASHFLGVRITRDRNSRLIYLSQDAYFTRILKKFGLEDCRPVKTPMERNSLSTLQPRDNGDSASPEEREDYSSKTGSLMYGMTQTRPDLAFLLSVLSRYMSNPSPAHSRLIKRGLRYLQQTRDHGLVLGGVKKDPESAWSITAWADSDWKGDTVTGRSTFGWLVQLEGSTVSWRAKRHETVALSTTEAEYTALSQCARELAWTRNLFSELLLPLYMPIPLNGDNQGSLKLCRNPELHQRTKHIPLTEHHIREEVEAGNIDVQYVSTYEQVADGLTKPLNTVSHGHFLEAIRVSACPIEEAGRIIWSTEVHDDSVP
ncbi:Retrovirus-related Pol polyprotein from transposon TNT [Fusarium oxysporum f. sp. cubense]|uniref:Retrovirus-related Pol polyprotein from transposon TNT n=1 Tax=Fusarium oxysporum f. sp. cubense TaxID=61366 RepID=A0A559LJX0_FUSOC|nr:Retrovirus-related Pol polyprotein from transposon TNT [Fusarium oxysporum f. sp. cubense]